MLTTVAIFEKPWEAHLFCMRLEAEGVTAFIQYENHVGMNWLAAIALGGMRIEELDAQVPDAVAIAQRCRLGEFRTELLEMFGDLGEAAE
jgi:hypothetical protein